MPRSQVAHRFTVIYTPEPDGSAWNVTIPAVEGCHTYGRSLAEARRHAREALAASLDEPDREAIAAAAELVEDIRLPKGTRAAVQSWRRARARSAKLDAAAGEAREAQAAAARIITQSLSLRDTGELLGLSQEGVRKLVKDRPGIRKAPSVRDTGHARSRRA